MNTIIVDDEKYALTRISGLLKSFDHINIQDMYTNPTEAVDGIINHQPDLLFIDIEMPGMTGFELVKHIKINGYNPKIIFVTAFDHYAIKAIKEQAFDYLLKPVDIEELTATLNRLNYSGNITPTTIENFCRKYELTKREEDILGFLLKGYSSKDIGNKLFISKHTVDTHRRNMLEKTGFISSSELVAKLLG